MFVRPSRITLLVVIIASLAPLAYAQLAQADNLFAGLSARTRQLAYQSAGGDMTAIAPLISAGGYRNLTHAMVLMNGIAWTPDAELTTALDFAIGAKLIGSGENLATRATFLFDAPAATSGPYRMRLDLLKADGSKEASVEPGITLGDVHGRKVGETAGLTLDPSKLVQPGLQARICWSA